MAALVININRARRLPDGYNWYCLHDPGGDFAGNVFSRYDLDSPDSWPDGIEFVHLESGEIRRMENGRINADFLVTCQEGQELYAAFRAAQKNIPAKTIYTWLCRNVKPISDQLREHVQTCPVCRKNIEVRGRYGR